MGTVKQVSGRFQKKAAPGVKAGKPGTAKLNVFL